MRENTRPRILLADDYPPFLEQAEKLLRNNYEIVGFARDGGEALSLCVTLHPDILLLDLSMPILSGLEVATRLRELGCRSKIVFVTAQNDRDYVEAAFLLGASGYVLKSNIRVDLLTAIDATLDGSTFTSPSPVLVATAPTRRL
jgi:DNA-binding NarL/FixJ family response regulator